LNIYEELDNNLTEEERELAIVSKPIRNWTYTALHKGHNQYKIIRKSRIEGIYEEWLDEILSEIICDDWRKYE